MKNYKTPTMTWQIYINNQDLITELQHDTKLFTYQLHNGDLSTAIQKYKQHSMPKHLIVEVSKLTNVLHTLQQLNDLCKEETIVVCVGESNDINFYKQLLEYGVDEYLPLPTTATHLADTINKITNTQTSSISSTKNSSTITIIGSRGGIGTSTIATNLSWLISKHYKQQCYLLDMDMYNGTTALMLNQNNNQGLAQALANSERIDNLFMERVSILVTKRLKLLAAELGIANHDQTIENELTMLLSHINDNAPYCIIDLNHNNPNTNNIIAASSNLLILIDYSMPSLRNTKKILEFTAAKSPTTKINIIGIQNSITKAIEIPQPQFEEGIKHSIMLNIPYDQKAVLSSINLGKVLASTNQKHPIINNLHKLLSEITMLKTQDNNINWINKLKLWGK